MRPVAVATFGVFDGFHRGHALVVAQARSRADRGGARLVAFTFENHPAELLAGRTIPPLCGVPERVRRLRGAGCDEVRVIRFTPRLAAKPAETFLAVHVFSYVRLTALVVGHDFALGYRRHGTVPVLSALGERLGFSVESVSALGDAGGPISSTRIREALAAGQVPEAARLLGRPPRVGGGVVSGAGRGRHLGYPTANIALDSPRVAFALGVYAVRLYGPGLLGAPGVANYGVRPTFDGEEEILEVHLLDFGGDLAGTRVEVELVSLLRDERKFNNVNDLILQIGRDVESARRCLAGPEAG